MSRTSARIGALCAAIAAAAAYFAHGYWPYAYYENFRIIICAASAIAAYNVRKMPLAAGVAIICGAIFNPFVPMRAHRYQWQQYDILVAIAMGLLAAYLAFARTRIDDAPPV